MTQHHNKNNVLKYEVQRFGYYCMKKLINYLKNQRPCNVLVIGDVMLDEYAIGSVSRISPEAPVPVVRQERQEWALGGAANVAANCAYIGCKVSLVGLIGDKDFEGQKLTSLLVNHAVSTDGIIQSDARVTTTKRRVLAASHQLLRVDYETQEPLSAHEFARVCERVDALMLAGSIVLVSDYAKGVITAELMNYIVLKARERNCIVMVDPKGTTFNRYCGVDFIKPNAKEYDQMLQFFGLDKHASLEENGRIIVQKLGLRGLIVTLGAQGIVYVDRYTFIHSPSLKREVFDLTGAGDTVFAFLAFGFAHNVSTKECLMLANHAASVAISHLKTYPVSLEELIDRKSEHDEKIYMDWAALKIDLDWHRADRKKVVFTNGCFDILHPGHISTLKEAKKCGDLLVVALNSDDSIRRLKGASRPINNAAHRATMMAALGLVDYVTVFEQDTPYEIISYLRPDVLVKGGDYTKESIVGYDVVTSYGGDVCVVDYIDGVSTTSIVTAIQNSSV